MPVLEEAVTEIMTQRGSVSCAIVDIETGECLSQCGVAVSGTLETAGLVNARMLRAKLRMVEEHHHESIEDILITLDRHFHVIRLIHIGSATPNMFIYLILDRSVSNLAFARRKLAAIEFKLVETPEATARLDVSRANAIGLSTCDDKVYGTPGGFGAVSDDGELPPFMRDDMAMKLLGIKADDEIREL